MRGRCRFRLEHMAFKEKKLGDGAFLWIFAKAMRDDLFVREGSGIANGGNWKMAATTKALTEFNCARPRP